jgi:hypothetical protein
MHFELRLCIFEREITGVMHFHAWHVPQLYYFREEVCFMYLQLQNQIAKRTTSERKKVGIYGCSLVMFCESNLVLPLADQV